MATPKQLRDDLAELVRLAHGDLDEVWRLAVEREGAVEALNDVLPALVDTYGAAAATVAADWYDDAREEQAIKGRFVAVAADIPDSGSQALVGWALDKASDDASFRMLVEGGLQRRILNFSRKSLIASSIGDPQARGWMRVGVGECRFCQMLISRGAVYTEATVRFGAHDHCQCQAAPAWGRSSDLFDVNEYRRSKRYRDGETREADNARAREWIADNL